MRLTQVAPAQYVGYCGHGIWVMGDTECPLCPKRGRA